MSAVLANAAQPQIGLGPDDATALLERQTEVLELIAGAAALPDVLAAILTSLEQLMPGARCSVLLLDREQATLHHGAAPSLPEPYVTSIDGMSIGDGAGSCGTAAATNAAVVAHDVRTDPRWTDFRALADAAGLRSCWSTPIEGRDGLPVGTFAVYHPTPHRPTSREQLLVDRFTHLASVAIDHAHLVAELVESEARFRTSFDDNSLGMAILGLDRTITTSNVALATLTGRRALEGLPLGEVLTARGRSLTTRIDDLDRSDVASVVFEALLQRDEGATVEVEVTISLLRGGDGDPVQYVVNVFDLTERRAAERERRARAQAETARRTAEELSHAKSELLAAVGHEARTPIQAIVGFAELLGSIDLDDARRREALEHIGSAAGHVMDLLTDVLDLSRLEANALPLAQEAVQVRDVVIEVFGLLSPTAERRGVELSLDLPRHVVLANRRRLRQVLLNLVGNAIRHGAAGGHVRVRSLADGARLQVSVDDDGPGIPVERLPRIFTPFACSDPAGDTSVGLGLALSHALMAAMGGDLRVAGSTPTGTCMALHLALATTDPEPDTDRRTHHERTDR